jgi:hypothetical protein
MSKCILSRSDVDTENLPHVCMRCGEAATTTFSKKFSWSPSWVIILVFFGLLPFLIAYLMTNWKLRVSVPFCERHRNHFSFRSRFGGFGFLA